MPFLFNLSRNVNQESVYNTIIMMIIERVKNMRNTIVAIKNFCDNLRFRSRVLQTGLHLKKFLLAKIRQKSQQQQVLWLRPLNTGNDLDISVPVPLINLFKVTVLPHMSSHYINRA